MAERVDSVHYLLIPTVNEALSNARVEQAVQRMQSVVELGRAARDKRAIGLKRPLRKLTVVHTDKAFLDDVAVRLLSIVIACFVCVCCLRASDTSPASNVRAVCCVDGWLVSR